VNLDLSAAAIALTTYLARDRKVMVKVDKLKANDTLKTGLKRRTEDEGEEWEKMKVRGLFSLRPLPGIVNDSGYRNTNTASASSSNRYILFSGRSNSLPCFSKRLSTRTPLTTFQKTS